jgi:hypothetical protein
VQGTRSVDFDEKHWLLILGLSLFAGHPLKEIDGDGATNCAAGTPTLERRSRARSPACRSMLPVLVAGLSSIAHILTVVSAVISWLHTVLQKRSEDTRESAYRLFCNVEIVQCDLTWTSNET